MIDILEMAKPEIERKKKLIAIITNLRLLKKAGKTNDEILEVIRSLDLPLDVHLFITGGFSALMNGTHKFFKRGI